ncbi:kell blood group glycoprotein isoform X2 [Gadus morhua]|uniref:Kell metallo-endopeptidase (Kell blood group) n=1 Tax=Gadus morhua TaxID=8049 RepID=A0A8C5BX88_GADMO|nr:kell blood group glycoprotein-like isoform X2 [Gadus morhua]
MTENQLEHELLPLPQSSFAQPPAPDHPQGPHQNQLLQGLAQHDIPLHPPSDSDSTTQNRPRLPGQSPRWTNHRRLILLVLLGSSLWAIVLVLVYYSQQDVKTQSKEITPTEKVTQCLSKACQRASVRLYTSVDPFSHPCDYFLITCGSDRPWPTTRGKKRSEGPPLNLQRQPKGAEMRTKKKEKNLDGNMKVEEILDRKNALMRYLQEALESKSRSGSAVQKVKDFYRSCLDTKSIETAGVEPFLTLVQQLGGWGISGQWNHSDFNSTLKVLIRQYASFPFFNLYVGRDPNEILRGTDRKYIQIDEPDLLIPIAWNNTAQKSIAKTQTLFPFLALCQKYLALLGAPSGSNIVHVGMFISLSSELAVATSPLSYRLLNGLLYQRITIKELANEAPVIDWLGCLQAAFHPHPVRPEDHVLLHNLPYIVQMSNVIQKWLTEHELRSSGPVRTFMFLKLLQTFTPALDSRFRETERRFYLALGHTVPEVPRWKHCITETEKGFDTVLPHILTDMATQRKAEEMLENIFSIFKTKLNHLDWGDNNSQQSLMKKVHSLTPRLWTQTESKRESELDLLFSEVNISTRSYFSNYIQLLDLQRQRRNRLFNQTQEDDIFSVRPFHSGNEVIFPMGMFVPPFFHATYPRAMNYGILGIFIAKDIFHLLLQDDPSLSEAGTAMAECVWAHYLSTTGRAGGGNATVLSAVQRREIWLQYSALQVAFQAYQQSLQRQPEDSALLHLSLTHLFLTSFAQVDCDTELYGDSMPLEPSFMITVLCSTSTLCPAALECPSKTQLHSLKACLPHSS